MRQVVERDSVIQRLGDRRDWFRLGMASATIMTPLISRWRALRAAERARALWQASQAGARWPFARPAASEAEVETLPPLARREVRTELWLAGVVVGLAAAGTAAFIVARRRLRADEPPLDVPLIVRTGDPDSPRLPGVSPATPTQPKTPTAPTLSADLTPNPANGTVASAGTIKAHAEPPPVPAFVGNTETLLYVRADGTNLPPEELRTYFASEAQATQAGYRPTPGA